MDRIFNWNFPIDRGVEPGTPSSKARGASPALACRAVLWPSAERPSVTRQNQTEGPSRLTGKG